MILFYRRRVLADYLTGPELARLHRLPFLWRLARGQQR